MKKMAWSKHIERASKSGKFSVTAKAKADHWPSCAVGEHLGKVQASSHEGIVRRLWSGNTAMTNLKGLGLKFAYAVNRDNVTDAKRILAAISKIKVYYYEGY